MSNSLPSIASYNTLKDYPLSTSFYFDHEQSYKSLQFSRFIEPKNKLIFNQKEWVKKQLAKAVYVTLRVLSRNNSSATAPTSLQKELLHNPFFRVCGGRDLFILRRNALNYKSTCISLIHMSSSSLCTIRECIMSKSDAREFLERSYNLTITF